MQLISLIKAVTTFPQQLVQESNAHQPNKAYERQCLYTDTTGRNLYIELEILNKVFILLVEIYMLK